MLLGRVIPANAKEGAEGQPEQGRDHDNRLQPGQEGEFRAGTGSRAAHVAFLSAVRRPGQARRQSVPSTDSLRA